MALYAHLVKPRDVPTFGALFGFRNAKQSLHSSPCAPFNNGLNTEGGEECIRKTVLAAAAQDTSRSLSN